MVMALNHNQEAVGLIPMQPFQFRVQTAQGVTHLLLSSSIIRYWPKNGDNRVGR